MPFSKSYMKKKPWEIGVWLPKKCLKITISPERVLSNVKKGIALMT